MPFDKFVELATLLEERRKAIQQSLRSISIEELRKIAKQHQEEFVDDPSRDEFLRLMAEHPHASFYHAVPEEDIQVLYCRDEDFGLWVLPGSGMGLLDEQGKRHMKEAIELSRSGTKTGGET